MEITAFLDADIWDVQLDNPSASLSQLLVNATSTDTELHITDTVHQKEGVVLGHFTYNGPKADLTTVTGTFTTLSNYKNGQLFETYHSNEPVDLTKFFQDKGDYLWSLLSGNDVFTGSLTSNTNDGILGLSGNDTFMGGGDLNNNGNDAITDYTGAQDWFNGGDGIDTAIYRGNRSDYTLDKQTGIYDASINGGGLSGYRVHDKTTLDGTDFLINVERLKFKDTNLALDIDGNAGKVVKLLGTVFGADSITNKQYVGIGLTLLDGGMSYSDLAAAALNAVGVKNHEAIVTTLWTNVMGAAPTSSDLQPFVALLDQGMTAGDFAILAAGSSFNTNKINLVGLAESGIEFI